MLAQGLPQVNHAVNSNLRLVAICPERLFCISNRLSQRFVIIDRSVNKVALKTWHKVSISRTDRTGILQVNDEPPVSGDSRGVARELNLKMKVYLGKFIGGYNLGSGVTTGFTGAIQKVSYYYASCVNRIAYIIL
jgi:hypothetical protein